MKLDRVTEEMRGQVYEARSRLPCASPKLRANIATNLPQRCTPQVLFEVFRCSAAFTAALNGPSTLQQLAKYAHERITSLLRRRSTILAAQPTISSR